MVGLVSKNKDVRLKPEGLEDKEEKDKVSHLFTRQPKLAQVEGRLTKWRERRLKHELAMKNKVGDCKCRASYFLMLEQDEMKQVALGTSKINYIDPRVSVAWCKRVQCPIEKVFAPTLRDKFPWAMAVKSTWKF